MEGIFQIDEIADQGVQFVNLRHTGNTKCVELPDEGLLEFLLVCEYGKNGAAPEIVVYKRR